MSSDNSCSVLAEASAPCRGAPRAGLISLLSQCEKLVVPTGLLRELPIVGDKHLRRRAEAAGERRKMKKRPGPAGRGVAWRTQFVALGIPELSAQNRYLRMPNLSMTRL
jgi:hypothetical protein